MTSRRLYGDVRLSSDEIGRYRKGSKPGKGVSNGRVLFSPREGGMNGSPMDTLQQLIHERMRELNLSYSEVARRCGLPRSTAHHLATHPRSGRLPSPGTLEKLAVGLNLPLQVVRAAAASAAGLMLDSQTLDDPEIEILVASIARLNAADRRHVAALVRSLLADMEAIPGAQG